MLNNRVSMPGETVLHFRLRKGGRVQRYHTEPAVGRQSVAEHSWGVAMLAREMWPDDMVLMRACLLHDLAEHQTGDMPANIKWREPALKIALDRVEESVNIEFGLAPHLTTLNATQLIRLKWCDLLECLWYCVEQMLAGVRDAKSIYLRVTDYIANNMMVDKKAMAMMLKIEEVYNEAGL